MKLTLRMSLRKKFILFFLLFAIIPALFVAGISVVQSTATLNRASNDIEDSELSKINAIALLSTNDIANYMINRKADTMRLMADPQVRSTLDGINELDTSNDAKLIHDVVLLFLDYMDVRLGDHYYTAIFIFD